MARQPVARLGGVSTAAIVTCSAPRFENAASVPDANFVSMDIAVLFNGVTGEITDKVTFGRNATSTEKQAAVRLRLNAVLESVEIGVTLNNANIQISGLPI